MLILLKNYPGKVRYQAEVREMFNNILFLLNQLICLRCVAKQELAPYIAYKANTGC